MHPHFDGAMFPLRGHAINFLNEALQPYFAEKCVLFKNCRVKLFERSKNPGAIWAKLCNCCYILDELLYYYCTY